MATDRRLIGFLFAACVAMLLAPFADARADQCIQKDDHEYLTFFLIEPGSTPADEQSLEQTVSALKDMIRPGERLIAAVIQDKSSDTRIVTDVVKPKTTIWESTLKLRAKEETFKNCMTQLTSAVQQGAAKHKKLPLLETLSFVSDIVSSDPSTNKRVIVHSGMVQNSESLSFLAGKNIDPDQAIKKSQKDGLLARFNGVTFFMAGAGRNVSDQKGRSIEGFWKKYVAESGGLLNFYGPILVAS